MHILLIYTNTWNIWRKVILWWLELAKKKSFKLNTWITRCWYIHQVVKHLPPSVLEYFITIKKIIITIPVTIIPNVFHVFCPISAPGSHFYKRTCHLFAILLNSIDFINEISLNDWIIHTVVFCIWLLCISVFLSWGERVKVLYR